MKEQDRYILQQNEPNRGALLALRDIILSQDSNITAEWKYGMPFFCYRGKMFCYLWIHKKLKQPYLGIVEGKRFDDTELIQEGRSRMKIFLIDPRKDLPLKRIQTLLKKVLNLYASGIIAIK